MARAAIYSPPSMTLAPGRAPGPHETVLQLGAQAWPLSRWWLEPLTQVRTPPIGCQVWSSTDHHHHSHPTSSRGMRTAVPRCGPSGSLSRCVSTAPSTNAYIKMSRRCRTSSRRSRWKVRWPPRSPRCGCCSTTSTSTSAFAAGPRTLTSSWSPTTCVATASAWPQVNLWT